jgi:hypothetical protein
LENRGIIDNRLISIPIHILNQEYDEIATIVPVIKEVTNMSLYSFIKKRRVLLSWTGYEPISLLSLSFYVLV